MLYRVINSVEDTNRLQEYLNRVSEWANTWQLEFNASKYTVICCTRSLTPLTHGHIHTLNVPDQHTCHNSLITVLIGVAYMNVCVLKHLKQELAWAIDK